MAENKDERYLSKYMKKNIDLNKLGHKTCIVSGVGSGKNYWVENELAQDGNVLLITSRRAKVDETIEQSIFEGNFSANEIGNFVVYSNSGMEKLIKNIVLDGTYDSFLDYFNYIVIDEAHSLVTDSTFADAPFHLWSFIRKMSEKKRIILMTGTIKPVEDLLKDDGWEIIDCRDECINIKPKRIIVETQDNIFHVMKKQQNIKGKTIYLANSASRIVDFLYKGFQDKSKIAKESIAFSMSDKRAEELLKGKMELEYERYKTAYSSITKEQVLPDDIKLLITTSRLKEGINIKNDNIKEVYCESHVAADMLQFGGRVRAGVDVLYIIGDARQNHNNMLLEIDYDFCLKNGLKACNDYLDNIQEVDMDMLPDYFGVIMSKTKKNEKIRGFVKFVEERFKYIRFNHMVNRFELYELRHLAVGQVKENFKDYDENRIEYLKKVFEIEEAQIEDRETKEHQENIKAKERWIHKINKELEELSYSAKKLFGEDKDKFKMELLEGLGLAGNPRVETINQEMEKNNLPYMIKSETYKQKPHRDERYYIVIKIIEEVAE